MRGLKQNFRLHLLELKVARSTRAWIETLDLKNFVALYPVARSTRAWIETHNLEIIDFDEKVARSTRAWIET